MYPKRELAELAARKAALQIAIARHRSECVAAVAQVTQPLELLDRAIVLWRRLSAPPYPAVIPLFLLAARPLLPRLKRVSTVLRWGPLIANVVSLLGEVIKRQLVKSRSTAVDKPPPLEPARSAFHAHSSHNRWARHRRH